jgi:hypothetical protein
LTSWCTVRIRDEKQVVMIEIKVKLWACESQSRRNAKIYR